MAQRVMMTMLAAATVLASGCGGTSASDQVTSAAMRYIAANNDRDAKATCETVTAARRARAERAARSAGQGGGCVTLLTDGWKRKPPIPLQDPKALTVRVDGDRARVVVQGAAGHLLQRQPFRLVREADGWRVSEMERPRTLDGLPVYVMPTGAMAPRLPFNHQVVVDDRAYDRASPQIGDVVLAYVPEGATENVACPGRVGAADGYGVPTRLCVSAAVGHGAAREIKRIVAGPGDRIAFRAGRAIRNGHQASEPFVSPSSCQREAASLCDFPRAIRIPAGRYYLAGDDRGNSSDSRLWGSVPEAWILGRVR